MYDSTNHPVEVHRAVFKDFYDTTAVRKNSNVIKFSLVCMQAKKLFFKYLGQLETMRFDLCLCATNKADNSLMVK